VVYDIASRGGVPVIRCVEPGAGENLEVCGEYLEKVRALRVDTGTTNRADTEDASDGLATIPGGTA
jgi:hypothetical protein